MYLLFQTKKVVEEFAQVLPPIEEDVKEDNLEESVLTESDVFELKPSTGHEVGLFTCLILT